MNLSWNGLITVLSFTIVHSLRLPTFHCGRFASPSRSILTAEAPPAWGEHHRVVGGNETKPHNWPWTAQLIYSETGIHRCGAAVIGPDTVITAAHCFSRSRNPVRYSVLIGGHELGSGRAYPIMNISIHPLYNFIMPSSFDVALVRLLGSIKFNETVQPLCLPTTEPALDSKCYVAGWGFQTESGEFSSTLRHIKVPLVSMIVCNGILHYFGRVDPISMLCAGTSGADACQGDSGGPLMCYSAIKKVWELQGVVSWGHGCGRNNSPGVYTKIVAVSTWANHQAKLLKLNDHEDKMKS